MQNAAVVSFMLGISEHGCGGLFQIKTEVTGKISFWHPEGYPNNLRCEWFIEMPEDSLITLSFTDFNLEADNGLGCLTEYLLIRNGNSNGEVNYLPIMAKECGADR